MGNMYRLTLFYAATVALAALVSACGQQEPVAPPTPQTFDTAPASDIQPQAAEVLPTITGESSQAPVESPPAALDTPEMVEPPETTAETPVEAPFEGNDLPPGSDTSAMEELIHAESVDEAPEPENLPEGDWVEEVPFDDGTGEIYQEEGVAGEETVDGGITEDGTPADVMVDEPVVDEEDEEVPPGIEVPAMDETEETEPSVIE